MDKELLTKECENKLFLHNPTKHYTIETCLIKSLELSDLDGAKKYLELIIDSGSIKSNEIIGRMFKASAISNNIDIINFVFERNNYLGLLDIVKQTPKGTIHKNDRYFNCNVDINDLLKCGNHILNYFMVLMRNNIIALKKLLIVAIIRGNIEMLILVCELIYRKSLHKSYKNNLKIIDEEDLFFRKEEIKNTISNFFSDKIECSIIYHINFEQAVIQSNNEKMMELFGPINENEIEHFFGAINSQNLVLIEKYSTILINMPDLMNCLFELATITLNTNSIEIIDVVTNYIIKYFEKSLNGWYSLLLKKALDSCQFHICNYLITKNFKHRISYEDIECLQNFEPCAAIWITENIPMNEVVKQNVLNYFCNR